MRCARCGGNILTTWDERVCMQCGWRDYAYNPPKPERSAITSVKQIARYAGDYPNPEGLTVEVSVERWGVDGRHESVKGGPQVTPNCPWCQERMTPTSITGSSRQRLKGERRY